MIRVLSILSLCVCLFACKKENKPVYFESPLEGMSVALGKSLFLKTDAKSGSFDSIRYYIDSKLAGSRKDTSGLLISTSGFPLGGRLLTAKIYKTGDSTEVTTNVQLLPAKAPLKYSYTIVNTYPHDTSSYTEGLEYHNGILYESDGGYSDIGGSSLRKTELKTGKVIKLVNIDGNIFAEGITVIGNKIIQLTYREGIVIEYDKETFKKLREFPYTIAREGWGLCFDGSKIYNTADGMNLIHILNKDSYLKEGTIEVYDTNGPVNKLNELEYIDGKIFSNVYTQNRIVIIDPKTGSVEAELNLDELDPFKGTNTDLVLNGIAWDAAGKRLFVTGKKWDKLFEIKINRSN